MIRPLSIVWNFDPVFFSIGSLDIRYYGLMWALAILIGAKFFDNFCKREGLPPKVSESIFIYGTLATIIGARLGHCLFYDPMEYLSKPWTIITGFRDGGMASHGAAIGLLIGLGCSRARIKLPYIWIARPHHDRGGHRRVPSSGWATCSIRRSSAWPRPCRGASNSSARPSG